MKKEQQQFLQAMSSFASGKDFSALKTPHDQQAVFQAMMEFVKETTGLRPSLLRRYAKFARYAIVYHVDWTFASTHTREECRKERERNKK
jgi:hypothetical protein